MNRSEERERRANGRRTRNVNERRFASDYYYNYNQPAWTERDEEWYRHTYGLPASGRMGQRRHDIAEWGNPSFTQNRTNKQYDRINNQHSDFQNQREDNSAEHFEYDRDHDRNYDYNRFGMGSQRGTWNRRGDESYSWGQNSSHYSTDREELAKHRGKGPKGFTRSDERIKDDISCRLTDDAYVDASEIDVAVDKGEVVLTGTVPDRSSKRRAEDIAELVSGVTNVENRLRVK
jgi:osmotically-inducible protein OsmY